MLLDNILSHTPHWVFVLFAALVWYGMKQMSARRVSLGRAAVMPLAMAGLSAYGVASAFGAALLPLAGWAAAALAVAALVLQRPLPAGTRYDPASRSFMVAGSAWPLALMMGIFFTKYIVGAALAMHPALARQAGFAMAVPLLYGAWSGVFAARGLRLCRLMLRGSDAGGRFAAGAAATE